MIPVDFGPPKKITLNEWSEQFRRIDDGIIKQYTYYDNEEWGGYLQPPATFMVYGARELKRLKLDNSFAALRLWGFVFNESERLFRAHQCGKKVIATMGDLGTVPVIVQSFPDCIPFYPECIWWTPFFNESTVLLDRAGQLGIPEATCFSKTVLAAFQKKAYFPEPDLIFASTGAACDDYSCIMNLVEGIGYPVTWLEIPYRKRTKKYYTAEKYGETSDGFKYPLRLESYLIEEYKKVWRIMSDLTGINDLRMLEESIKKVNRMRKLVEKIKELTYTVVPTPLPALELMTIEFGNLYGYADIDEWLGILEMLLETVEERSRKKVGVLPTDAIPIAWITPSADPYLLNLIEEMGLRVAATEYVIRQALVEIEENIEPFRALARSFLNGSLIGSTEERIERIKSAIDKGVIHGVFITNMLGASHCAMETKLIAEKLDRVPVLAVDVPPPFGITEQLKTRIAAFAEMLRQK